MKKILIIGGGFAGIWAAFSATRLIHKNSLHGRVEVTLINKDNYHAIRPRFYEQDLEKAQVKIQPYLDLINANLIVGEVQNIDTTNQVVNIDNQEYSYDKLILATGSQLIQANISGFKEYGFNIDNYQAAKKLKDHIERLPQADKKGKYTICIVGGSFTGIEVATDIIDRLEKIAGTQKVRVIILDRGQVASRFSEEMRSVFATVFDEMQIETRNNVTIENINRHSIVLTNGETIDTQTVVWTAGIQASPLTKLFNLPLDKYSRLPVDRFLRIMNVKNCFAAGDVAHATTDGIHDSLLSCQHAIPQGRFAGNNAIADLFGLNPEKYEQAKFVTCIDLGSWGAVYAENWNQTVINIKDEAKKIKNFINTDRIYPPALEKGLANLLEAAEPAFKAINS